MTDLSLNNNDLTNLLSITALYQMASPSSSPSSSSSSSSSDNTVLSSEQLLSKDQFLSIKDNNFIFSPDSFNCVYPVIVEILKGHYIRYALTASPSVPMIYVQQFWHTLSYVSDEKNYFQGKLDQFEVTFTLGRLRKVLQLKGSRAFPGKVDFDDLPTEEDLCADIVRLGYGQSLPKASSFKRMHLAPLWFTLFSIINRCLTSKHTGLDACSISVLRMFHGIAYNKHYDYAHLIWNELIDVVRDKGTTSKARKFIPFQRFLQIIIFNIMRQHIKIPKRVEEPTIPVPSMKYLRKDGTNQNVQASQIPTDLLAYADQNAPSVIEYRQSITPMVHLESEGPTKEATLELGYDQGSGDFDRGEQMENSERGDGEGDADQHTFSEDELSDTKTIFAHEPTDDTSDTDDDQDEDNDNANQGSDLNIISFVNTLNENDDGVENTERMIEEGETGLKEQENPSQTESVNRVTTSTNGFHVLESSIEQVVMDPVTHARTSPSLNATSSLEPNYTLSRTQELVTTASLRDFAGTSIAIPISGISRGLEGNPTRVNITPSLNVGHTVDSTVVLTEPLCEPRVTSYPDLNLESAINAIQQSLSQQLDEYKRLMKGKGIATDVQPPPPPQAQQHADLPVEKLKDLLLAKLLSTSEAQHADIDFRFLRRQHATSQNIATKEDIERLSTEIKSSTNSINEALAKLSERVAALEDSYKSQAHGIKRKHDDYDDPNHHYGEKRQRREEADTSMQNVRSETNAEEVNVEKVQEEQTEVEEANVENWQMIVFQNPDVEPIRKEGCLVLRDHFNKIKAPHMKTQPY